MLTHQTLWSAIEIVAVLDAGCWAVAGAILLRRLARRLPPFGRVSGLHVCRTFVPVSPIGGLAVGRRCVACGAGEVYAR